MQHQIVTNVADPPDILVIGPAGAQDLMLFEYSDLRASRYQSLLAEPPIIVTSHDDGKRYIRLPRKWGGAAHYILQELLAEPLETRVALWTVLGEGTNVASLTADLEALGASYYLVTLHNVNQPIYPGVVFETGERYWSKELIVFGAAEHLDPDYLPAHLRSAKLLVLAAQPMVPLLKFFETTEKQIAAQLFENHLPELLQDPMLREGIWHQLCSKCVLLNLNEVELWLVGRIFYNLTEPVNLTPKERAALTDKLVDQLSKDLKSAIIIVGLGPLGAHLVCRTNRTLFKASIPALTEQGIFGVGGGDVAWASALRAIANLSATMRFDIGQMRAAYENWSDDHFIEVLRAFVLGGMKGSFIPDIFDLATTSSSIFKKNIESWRVDVRKLPIMRTVQDLANYHQVFTFAGESKWASHEATLAYKEDRVLEALVRGSYGEVILKRARP